MAKRVKPSDISKLTQEVGRLSAELASTLTGTDDIRKQAKLIHAVQSRLAVLGASLGGNLGESARERILNYLKLHVGQVVDGTELATVAGISEYARRIRELRKEHGWRVISGAPKQDELEEDESTGLPKMKPDQYILLDANPDPDAAEKWQLANSIRKGPGSIRDKILKYLRANVGRPVDKEELRYVAQGSEWARRVRELRTEYGWAVMTRNTGRPDLGVGMYVLEHQRQAEPHDRHIPEKESQIAYERANYTCEECGWNQSKWRKETPRFLELHHIVHHAKGGTNTADNLRCLCNVCHDELHKRERLA